VIRYRLPESDLDLLSMMRLARELHGRSEWKNLAFDDAKTYNEIISWTRRGYQDPDAFLRVAFDGHEALGLMAGIVDYPFFSSVPIAFDHAHYVRSDSRHLMIGPRLIKQFLVWSKERGARSIMLSVTSGANRRMDRFLERWKFRPVGTNYRRDA
jgi:GNAT superfamily N-acetyltransferase